MKFRTADQVEAKAASIYLNKLIAKGNVVEVKRVSHKRTLSQNSYIHLLFGVFGIETGYTLAEAKTIYKRVVNPDIFVYEKSGLHFLRSSADLSKDEMQKSIDRFIQYAADNGIELPLAEDKEMLMYYENMIEKEGHHL